MKRGSVEGLRTRTACVVSHRYRFLYLTTAKNATTSLKAELTSERCGGEVLARAEVAREVWDGYFTFAFLRDPLERLLSAYQEVSLRMERGEVEEHPFGMMPDGLPRFHAFLDELESAGPWNEHIAPQTSFVEGRRVDFWGRIETIQEDLGRLYAKLGMGQCPILPMRRSRRWRAEREGIHRYVVAERDLDPSTVGRIRELYREDAELIESVRPDARVSPAPRRFVPAGMEGEPARVTIALADGSTHSLELPADHSALADLLACVSPEEASQTLPLPRILQLPLDGGEAALTFSPRDLVRVEIRAGQRAPLGPTGGAPATVPPAKDVSWSGRPAQRARDTRLFGSGEAGAHAPEVRDGTHQFTNVDEAHLGGYVRAIPERVRGTAATPHGDHATWYPLLWQWLIEEVGVRSMLDVGCGEGHAAGFFRDAGCEVLGVDGSLQARGESVIPEFHAVHDFVDGPFVPDRRFDLVWSCEFVEHVEERFVHNFLAAFASSRKYLLVTYAHPGQPGWHHVNCRDEAYWIERLGRLGFGLDRTLTSQARALASHDHFKDRGLVLTRRDERDDASFALGSGSVETKGTLRSDPLPIHPMEVARLRRDSFYLFLDVFAHATEPKIVAVSCPYGDDWNPAEHGIDYDAVDLVLDARRIRGRCLRHRLDSWEPGMLLEFEDPELEARIREDEEISFTIEVGRHAQRFTVPTRPAPPVDVAMSLVVRDENRWIRFFLEYHLHCLKAQHVFVYDNGTADREELLSILAPYRARAEVTYIPWDFRWRNRKDRKMIAQPAQEAHSLARFANCRWIGFLDVDEFLRLPHTTLPAFLDRFRAAAVDGLSFGVRWFSYRGPLGFDEVDNPPLTYLHSRRDPYGRKKQKLFVKGGSCRFLRLHWLEEGKRELPVDDTEIFFHHYEQRAGRFEQGKNAPGQYDDYMLRFRDRLSLPPNRRPPLGEREWIAHIRSAFESAEQCRSRLTEEVLALDGMCGRYTRHFYNNLCGFEGCRYLEIGSFRGASTCAAIYGNDVGAVCIDNWSQFRGKRDHFEAAVERFRGRSTVEVIEANCFEVNPSKLGPFDVFLYDGAHTRESHYRALERFVPTLAEYAVVVVDDWNRPAVKQGTREAVRDLGLDVVFDEEIDLAPEDTADENRERGRQGWWNGLYAMLVRRRHSSAPQGSTTNGNTKSREESPANDLRYEDMYLPIEPDFLRQLRDRHAKEVDAIAETYVGCAEPGTPRLPARNAVAISVFCAQRMNRYPNELPMTEEKLSAWTKSYADRLMQNLRDFPALFDTEQWKVIAYVCPTSLEQLRPGRDVVAEIAAHEFVELRVMKHPSVGHGPGALWRLLSFSDHSLDELLIYDIDEPWDNTVNRWHVEARDYERALARGVHMPRKNFWINFERAWCSPNGRLRHYPPILCSKIHARPRALGIPDIGDLIAAYVFLRMRQSRSSNPVSQIDASEPVTPYNRPTSREPCGHQNHWYQYCFDERFLKHVIFPYAARNGLLCTYCLPQEVTSDLGSYLAHPTVREFLADFRFTQRSHPANVIVNNHRAIDETL